MTHFVPPGKPWTLPRDQWPDRKTPPPPAWVVCPACEGDEGHYDTEAAKWVDCTHCDGSGGWPA